jgi:hypothetical protein
MHILGRIAMIAVVLGTVQISRAMVADGKPLPAGTYVVRLADAAPPTAIGQSAGAERWIEFLKGGTVVGRELATVISDADMPTIAKGARPHANSSLVEMINNGEHLRVWINKDTTNYLIHLIPAKSYGTAHSRKQAR